jgi:hypothetical protein
VAADAFGVLMWEMLTGARPWAGLRHVQIITHKMRNGSQLKWPSDVYPAYKVALPLPRLRILLRQSNQGPVSDDESS